MLGDLDDDALLLTPAALAKAVGKSVPTIYRWSREDPNFPKPRKYGQSCFFVMDEVRQWVSELPVKDDPDLGTPSEYQNSGGARSRKKRRGLPSDL